MQPSEPTETNDFDRIGRIIQLIKLHRQAQTPLAQSLNQEQYLKYFLIPGDWAFWRILTSGEISELRE